MAKFNTVSLQGFLLNNPHIEISENPKASFILAVVRADRDSGDSDKQLRRDYPSYYVNPISIDIKGFSIIDSSNPRAKSDEYRSI